MKFLIFLSLGFILATSLGGASLVCSSLLVLDTFSPEELQTSRKKRLGIIGGWVLLSVIGCWVQCKNKVTEEKEDDLNIEIINL